MTTIANAHEVTCYCGAPMVLEVGRWGPRYLCSDTTCDGTHTAHADGRPMGKPADKATRKLRMQVHELFDRQWLVYTTRKMQCAARKSAYQRLADGMDLPPDACHIGAFDADQCRQALELLRQ